MAIEVNVERPTAQSPGGVPDSSKRDEEAELIAEARNGSPTAIEQLVERYEDRLFRLARNITGNHEDSEEVVQNAFVKAFQNLASFRGDSRFYWSVVQFQAASSMIGSGPNANLRGSHYTTEAGGVCQS